VSSGIKGTKGIKGIICSKGINDIVQLGPILNTRTKQNLEFHSTIAPPKTLKVVPGKLEARNVV
jgi:hypothetical protein